MGARLDSGYCRMGYTDNRLVNIGADASWGPPDPATGNLFNQETLATTLNAFAKLLGEKTSVFRPSHREGCSLCSLVVYSTPLALRLLGILT